MKLKDIYTYIYLMKCLDFMLPGEKPGGKLFNDSFSIFEIKKNKKKKTFCSGYLNFNHVFIGKKNVSEIK